MLEVAICDDEKKDLEEISDMLREIFREIGRECHISLYQSPEDLFNGYQKINIGILDIVMPKSNGIDVGKKLKERFPEIDLIYTTSYEDYYNQVINKVHAFSFLLKPVDRAALKEQILECIREIPKKERGIELIFENVRNEKGEKKDYVQLSTGDILYCEYVKAKREIAIVLEKETYYYREVFETMAKKMTSYGFAVNCRGSIVNFRHIQSLKGYSIYLDNGTELQLSQKRVADFKEQMNYYIHKS